jgi:hypothetical protein
VDAERAGKDADGICRAVQGTSAARFRRRPEPQAGVWFVSNRPINTNLLEAVNDAAEGVSTRHRDDLEKLERFTNLSGTALAAFCRLLHLEGNQEGLWDQRNILAQDISYYLPDADVDAPVQLKELITKKALSGSAQNPAITRMDVLRALKTDESRLFPAPCLINALENVVPRDQEPELLKAIEQVLAAYSRW